MWHIQIIVFLLSVLIVSPTFADINSDLLTAAAQGHTDSARLLLENGANVNAKNPHGESALILAAKYGHTGIVKRLLEAGAKINAMNKFGQTSLILSAKNGHSDTVKTLLESGANVNDKDLNGKTALIVSAKNGHTYTVETLLEKNADTNVQDKNGKTALMLSAIYGYIPIVQVLINKGVDVNARDMLFNTTALMEAARKGHIAIVKLLLDSGADVNAKDSHGQTALIRAAKHGFSGTSSSAGFFGHGGFSNRANSTNHIDTIRALLDRGADLNAKDREGWTALMRAAEKGYVITVKILLSKGADVNVQNKFGKTALMYAKQKGYNEIVKLIQEDIVEEAKIDNTTARKNNNTDEKDQYGREKLFNASRYGRIEEMQALLDKGININVKDDNGATALIFAAHYGKKNSVQFLVEQGADVNAKDKYGGTALISARNNGHDEIVRLLEEAGKRNNRISSQTAKDIQVKKTEIKAKDDTGMTAVILADQKDNQEVKIISSGRPGRQNDGLNRGTPEDISPDLLTMLEKGKIHYKQTFSVKTTNVAIEKRLVDPPLIAAAREGDTAAVEDLLAKGADVKVREEKLNETALLAAAKSGHTDIVQILLEKGADVNEKDVFGWTALMIAAENGHFSTVRALLVKGADMKIKNEFGTTAFRLATKNRHKKIVRLFKKVKKVKAKLKKRPLLKTSSDTVVVKHRKKSLKTTGARWAVIIGISDYKDSRIPHLQYASDDAQAFYDWAISSDGGNYIPSQVKLLVDESATENSIKEALFIWLSQASEKDLITIYFAGHGSPESPEYPDNFFLFAHDTQQHRVASTGFPLWSIEVALERFIKAKKVILIVDAYNPENVSQDVVMIQKIDGEIKVKNPINTGLQNLSKVSDRICIITASDNKQLPHRGKRWGGGHGVFTYFLLNGLRGEADVNDDNIVTLGEVTDFVIENVARATKNTQHPDMAGIFDREFPMAFFQP
jgi:ankyrin repeat protein